MAIRSASPTRFQGQPWSNWTDFLGRVSPKEDAEVSSCVYKPPETAMKLPREDMDLLGFCPERDQFSVVVCETCHAVVKPQSLKYHIENRHSAEGPKSPPTSPVSKKVPTKTFKTVLKNGKSKIRLKKPSSVIIAKADSTTKRVVVNNVNDTNSNNMAVASCSNMVDTADEVVSSTTYTAKPVAGVMTSILTNGVSNGAVTNGIIGMNSSLMLTPPASDVMDDSESPVSSSISLTGASQTESDEKLSMDSDKNGELQPIVALSPLVNNNPNSPAAPILTKPPPPPVSLSVTCPPNNIPPVLSVAPATVRPAGLPIANTAKPRRIVRAERRSLSSKEKEYNADKHCGVVIGDAKPCTRSLTCRLHSNPLIRAVEGRSKPFDQLLAEHRASKAALNRQKKTNETSNNSHNTSAMAVINVQINESAPTAVLGGSNLNRVNVTTLTNSVGTGTNRGGCGPLEIGIRLPVSLLSPPKSQTTPALGSCTSELMTATPLDATTSMPLSSVNLTVNGTPYLAQRSMHHIDLSSFDKLIGPPEAVTPNISTAVDITVTRAHPKPLALGLFNSHKIGGLIYGNRKIRVARHFVKDLEDLY